MIKLLSNTTAKDIPIVGIKAGYLGELKAAGFNVPDGFVITADSKATYESDVMSHFDELGKDYVAVRSSPAPCETDKSVCVGQLESKMWVRRWELMDAIADCKNSLGSRKVEMYMLRKGITKSIPLAVLIHEMVESSSAGVISTVRGSDTSAMVINACFGAGHAVVSGREVPDCYIIDRKSGEIIDEKIKPQKEQINRAGWSQVKPDLRKKRKLSDGQIEKIVETAKQIEKYFGTAQDIEFCFDNEELWILQTNPILP